MSPQEVDRRIERKLAHRRLPYRGRLTTADFKARVQRAQLTGLANEPLEQMEIFQHFGFTSSLPAGTELILVPVGGKTSHTVVVASENGALRMKLEKTGETAIYSKNGDYVWIRDGRIVQIKAATKVLVDTPLGEFTQDVKVGRDLLVVGSITGATVSDETSSMQDMRETYNVHDHHENNPPNGNTNQPNQLMGA